MLSKGLLFKKPSWIEETIYCFNPEKEDKQLANNWGPFTPLIMGGKTLPRDIANFTMSGRT